jgi:hypothetical protein
MSNAAQKRIEAMIAEGRANGTLEESVPLIDYGALANDTSEADALYERKFAADRGKALAADKSETKNLWSRGR